MVIGGGKVAEQKVRTLLRCGARVVLIGPSITAWLKSQSRSGRIIYRKRSYRSQDLEGAFLVVAATHDREVQEKIAKHARKSRLLVNTVDRPELCSFISPSVLTRGDLTIAISTGGKSPALARRLRQDLGKKIGRSYGDYLSWMSSLRKTIQREVPSPNRRRRIFYRILNSGLLEQLQKGNRSAAKRRLSSVLKDEGLPPLK